jgi:hypothetical protein
MPAVRFEGHSTTERAHSKAAVERRYLIGALLCAGAYVGLVIGDKLAIRALDPHGAALTALAVAPAAPIIAYFMVFARYLAGVDEYRRHRMAQALLIAAAVTLSVSSVWDFLQAYGGQPGPEPFIFTTGFILVFGLAQGALQLIDKLSRRA